MTTQKNKHQLHSGLIEICDQIGVPKNKVPILILDRKTMPSILVANHKPNRAAGHGECFWDLNLIFVDTGRRKHYIRHYPWKRIHRWTVKKMTYRELKHILVHELVHYRSRYLRHGTKFEKRIMDILRGRKFEEKRDL